MSLNGMLSMQLLDKFTRRGSTVIAADFHFL